MAFRRNIPIAAALLVAAGLLSACNATVVNHSDFVPCYSRSLVISGVQDGQLATVVHGGASAQLDQAATSQVVVENVRPPAWLGDTRLVASGTDAKRRLVFVMNPQSIGQADRNSCNALDQVATSGPDGGQLNVIGAFCDDTDTMSATRGSIKIEGDGRQNTVDLVQQMTLILLPQSNPVNRYAAMTREEFP